MLAGNVFTAHAESAETGSVASYAPGANWGGIADTAKIRYVTESPTGATIIATGIIAVPDGPVPRQGWPVVAWDHGTRGLGPACGLTARPGVDAELVRRLVDLGYAVVAPDYVGLGPGAETAHPYLQSRTEATATIDLVRAARHADPRLSNIWAVAGLSQGGHAALNSGYLADGYAPELDFRGIVALAPASNVENVLPMFGPQAPALPVLTPVVGLVAAVFDGMRVGAPDFDLGPYLTADGAELLDRMAFSCGPEWAQRVGTETLGSVLAQPLSAGPLRDRLRRYASVPTAGYSRPILIAHGMADITVPIAASMALTDQLRANGVDFTFRTYPAADHDGVVDAAWPDVVDFLGRVLPRPT
ncbi:MULTISPECIES: S9 family peptidase [unclassified Nocardia]|uniref:alpha/beta hydrolase family protein n=1 Tax=unclassified Nocardia TaxID=2637762 RepID=UPI001CE4B010|nr:MULTISPECIES: lipase family protein [unclassified Nocardia]